MSSVSRFGLGAVAALLLAVPFAGAQPPWQTPTQPRQYPPAQPPSYTPAQPPSYTPAQPPSYTPAQPPSYTPAQPPSYTPAPPAGAAQDPNRMIWSYYRRYLHRRPDPDGIQSAMIQFQNGETPTGVQAGLIGSDEYYQNHGSNPNGFIAGLYDDVLGRQPSPRAMDYWMNQLNQDNGNRQQMALDFLNWANRRR